PPGSYLLPPGSYLLPPGRGILNLSIRGIGVPCQKVSELRRGTVKYLWSECRSPIRRVPFGRRDAVPARWGLRRVDRRRDPALLRPFPPQGAVQDRGPAYGRDARQDRPRGRGGPEPRGGLARGQVPGFRGIRG